MGQAKRRKEYGNDGTRPPHAATRREVFRRVKPSVVAIAIPPGELVDPRPGDAFTKESVKELYEKIGIIGSGFFVHESGIAVTAKHVVQPWIEESQAIAKGASQTLTPLRALIHVPTRQDAGRTLYGFGMAPIDGIVSDETLDLAVLRVRLPKTPLPPLSVLESATSDCEEGDQIGICGYPYGRLLHREILGAVINPSFSAGIVSAVFPYPGAPRNLSPFFQIDAVVNPGNSGGPVFDLVSGKALGVVVQWTRIPKAAMLLVENPRLSTPTKKSYTAVEGNIEMPIGYGHALDARLADPLIIEILKPESVGVSKVFSRPPAS